MGQFTYPLKSAGVLGHSNGVYPDSLNTATLIEGFEDGNITEYGGDTADFSVQTTTVQEGSYAVTGDGSNASHSVISDTATSYSAGTTFTFRYYGSGGPRGDFAFAAQNENGASGYSGYSVRVRPGSGDTRLQKWSSGGITTVNSTTISQPGGAWNKCKIEWGSAGSFTITLYDSAGTKLGSYTASDSTYTSGGIGFHKYETGIYYDAVKTL